VGNCGSLSTTILRGGGGMSLPGKVTVSGGMAGGGMGGRSRMTRVAGLMGGGDFGFCRMRIGDKGGA